MRPLPRPVPVPIPEDDDTPLGRILSRREVLALMGASGAALATVAVAPRVLAQSPAASAAPAASAVLPSCIVRPALTEGPLFVDLRLDRSDIRLDTDGSMVDGTPLELTFLLSRIDGTDCTAFAGATVDVWHCDAEGVYSAVNTMGMETSDQIFLRGYQVSDADGRAAFTTIIPGWYSGRAVHIHFKIRTFADQQTTWDFTSQLFFDPAFLQAAYAVEPYAQRGQPDVPNDQDGIYRGGGSQLLLAPTSSGDGYAATFEVGLQMS
ncbi:MAG: twin-arginine translocation pathway signal protein [Chloroflexota bacterium]